MGVFEMRKQMFGIGLRTDLSVTSKRRPFEHQQGRAAAYREQSGSSKYAAVAAGILQTINTE